MRMTPLEIQNHRFARRLRGYDRDEVRAFLAMVSDDYESIMRESESQRQRMAQLEQRMDELVKQEQLLKLTLINAQSISDKMRETSERECSALLAEAEVRAEKLIDASHRRAARLAQDIREMKSLRSRLAETLRSSIETHLGLIKNLETDPAPEAALAGGEEGVMNILEEVRIAYLAIPASGRRRKREAREPSPAPTPAPTGPGGGA